MSYAEGTKVPVEQTQGEIRKLLVKHGATHFAFGSAPERDIVQFQLAGRHYRFTVERPTVKDIGGKFGTRPVYGDWGPRLDSEYRRRWRARLLWIKAMLEFAEDEPLSKAMLAYLLLPDGRTFSDWADPQVEAMYERGEMPALLGTGL